MRWYRDILGIKNEARGRDILGARTGIVNRVLQVCYLEHPLHIIVTYKWVDLGCVFILHGPTGELKLLT